jgi:hypothetical protein
MVLLTDIYDLYTLDEKMLNVIFEPFRFINKVVIETWIRNTIFRQISACRTIFCMYNVFIVVIQYSESV